MKFRRNARRAAIVFALVCPLLAGAGAGAARARSLAAGEPGFSGTPAIEYGRPVVATFVNFGPDAFASGERGLGSAGLSEGRSLVRTPEIEGEAAVDAPDLRVMGRLSRPGDGDGAVRSHARLSRTLRVVGAPRGERVRVEWRIDYDVRFRPGDGLARPIEMRLETRLRDGRDRPVSTFEIRDRATERRGPYVGSQRLVVELVAGMTYEIDVVLEAFTAAPAGGAYEGTLRQRLVIEG